MIQPIQIRFHEGNGVIHPATLQRGKTVQILLIAGGTERYDVASAEFRKSCNLSISRISPAQDLGGAVLAVAGRIGIGQIYTLETVPVVVIISPNIPKNISAEKAARLSIEIKSAVIYNLEFRTMMARVQNEIQG